MVASKLISQAKINMNVVENIWS